MLSQNTPNKLSRRHWLRNAAIATTSAAVLPSLLTGCTDHPPGLGVPTTELTEAELDAAAMQLGYMRKWYLEMRDSNKDYVQAMGDLLNGGSSPYGELQFIVDIFTEIGMGILEVMEIEIPLLGPAIAIASELTKHYALEPETTNGLFTTLGVFKSNYHDLTEKTLKSIDNLTQKTNPDNPNDKAIYTNLKAAFKGGYIEFNGKQYTLLQLAHTDFPYLAEGSTPAHNPQIYNRLKKVATDKFNKYFWNLIIKKVGYFQWHYAFHVPVRYLGGISEFAKDEFYNKEFTGYMSGHSGTYLRGYYSDLQGHYVMQYWTLSFDGKELSPEAAERLFIDSIPGQTWHPDRPEWGVLPRDYVFKQLGPVKKDFGDYFDIVNGGHANSHLDFDESSADYDYTGGDYFKKK